MATWRECRLSPAYVVAVGVILATCFNQGHGVRLSGSIRLVNGGSPGRGRVEILHNNHWGTICDDYFRNPEARAICRQLGYRDGVWGYFGAGSGIIWGESVDCRSTATDLSQCTFYGWGVHNCDHSEDIGVTCSGLRPKLEGTIRLVNGSPSRTGRLEIFHNGIWGTVCHDSFGNEDASLVCRQLGYGNVGIAHSGAHFGQGSGPIWVDDVDCPSGATYIRQCNFRGWGAHDCHHGEDVGVTCIAPLRLIQDLPSTKTITTAGHLSVPCTFEAFPAATIEWTYGGSTTLPGGVVVVPGNTTTQDGKVRTSSYLRWSQASAAHSQLHLASGVYQCRATSGEGTSRSKSMTLVVTFPPRFIQDLPSSKTTTTGEHLSAFCGVESRPEATIQWTYGGSATLPRAVVVVPGNRTTRDGKVTTSSYLRWSQGYSQRHLASGVYQCSATNVVGTSRSRSMTLAVQFPPRYIQDIPSTKTITTGEYLSVFCGVESRPEARIQWTYGGSTTMPTAVVVVPGNRTTRDGKVTTSSHLRWSQGYSQRHLASGVYQCSATNVIGTSRSRSMTLTVQYAPYNVRVNMSSPFTLAEGERLVMEGQADCSPPCNLSWTVDGVTLSHTSGGLLVIDTIRRRQAGNFTLNARNDIGSLDEVVEVIVNYPPTAAMTVIPKGIVQGSRVKLQCIVDSNPMAQVTWSNVTSSGLAGAAMNSSSGIHFLVLDPVDCLDSGIIRCTAINGITPAGSAEAHIKVSCLTWVTVGAVVASAILVNVIAVAVVVRCRRRQRGKRTQKAPEDQVEQCLYQNTTFRTHLERTLNAPENQVEEGLYQNSTFQTNLTKGEEQFPEADYMVPESVSTFREYDHLTFPTTSQN